MQYQLNIVVNNDAFQGKALRDEMASIFRKLADQLDAGKPFPIRLLDTNGNSVGIVRRIS